MKITTLNNFMNIFKTHPPIMLVDVSRSSEYYDNQMHILWRNHEILENALYDFSLRGEILTSISEKDNGIIDRILDVLKPNVLRLEYSDFDVVHLWTTPKLWFIGVILNKKKWRNRK